MSHYETLNLVIPHYNAPEQLKTLLDTVTQLGCDSITVLDDASTDLHAVQNVANEFDSVRFVYGENNVGAGANRNRALEIIDNGLLWFLDVDTEVVSERPVEVIRANFSDGIKLMMGGIILTKLGVPMQWNYGHEMNPVDDARFVELARQVDEESTEVAWQQLKRRHMDYEWLKQQIPAGQREVDWVSEACFVVSHDDFERVGGYDTSFRYHEGQDLAHRLRDDGVKVKVDPRLVVKHLEIDVRGKQRDEERREGAFQFYQKHWGMSREVFDQLTKEY